MLELGLKTLIAYLLGSVVGALVVGQFRGVDIRTHGQRQCRRHQRAAHPGTSPSPRPRSSSTSARAGLPQRWLPGLAIPVSPRIRQIARDWLAASAAAAAAVAGHIWPIWHDFRGGKGGATLAGALLALSPVLLAVALGAWFVVVAMLTGSSASRRCGRRHRRRSRRLLAASRPGDPGRVHGGDGGCSSPGRIAATSRASCGHRAAAGKLWLFRPRGPRR